MQPYETETLRTRVSELERRLELLEEDRQLELFNQQMGHMMLDPSLFMGPDEGEWEGTKEAINKYADVSDSPIFYVPGAFDEFMRMSSEYTDSNLDNHAFMAVFTGSGSDFSFEEIQSRYESLYVNLRPRYTPFDDELERFTEQDVPDEYQEQKRYIVDHPDEVFDLPEWVGNEFDGWEDVADCLIQALTFMRNDGAVVARTRKTFDGLMNAGSKVISIGKQGFDTLVGKTVKKSGPVNNADRARAIGKWIGIATPELLPLVGIPLSGGSTLALNFIMAFDPEPERRHAPDI